MVERRLYKPLVRGSSPCPPTKIFPMKYNALIPELSVSQLNKSRRFYVEALGFEVAYERPEDGFIFLQLGGAQLMIEQANDHWATGDLEPPFGRGINFQIEVKDPEKMADRLKSQGITLFREVTRTAYDTPNGKEEAIEFLVQDPDGYLLRFCN